MYVYVYLQADNAWNSWLPIMYDYTMYLRLIVLVLATELSMRAGTYKQIYLGDYVSLEVKHRDMQSPVIYMHGWSRLPGTACI